MKERFSFLENYKIVDYILAVYVLFTAMYISYFHEEIPNFKQLLLVRLFILGMIFVFLRSFSNPFLNFFRNFYPLALSAYFYGETGLFNTVFLEPFDEYLIQIDQWIFGFQPAVEFGKFMPQAWFSELMFFGYFSYYFIVFGYLFYLYFKQFADFEIVSGIVIFSFYLSYILYFLFPSVGPQFYFPQELSQVPNSGIFSSLIKFIQEVGEKPTGAFPSSHISISYLMLYLIYRNSKYLFKYAFILVLILSLSTVYIKAHYFIDVIGGLLMLPIFLIMSNKIFYKNKYYIFEFQSNTILFKILNNEDHYKKS